MNLPTHSKIRSLSKRDIIPFSKYSGCGNDFILVDNRQKVFDTGNVASIAKLCHRQLGIGADGMIFLEDSHSADFRMRIFNSDGSEAEMCGNGIRCLGRFLNEIGISGNHFLIETMHHRVPLTLSGEFVKVQMPDPSDMQWDIPLSVEGKQLTVHYLDTGVPHAVLFVDDLEEQDMMAVAPQIRHHSQFSPKGANVNFAAIGPLGEIGIRTYERGVEGETLSCGTGAVAAAIAAAIALGHASPVTICPRSRERLIISFERDGKRISHLAIEGPAIKVFEGRFIILGLK